MTAKAIDDRLTEDEGVFPTSASGALLREGRQNASFIQNQAKKCRLILPIRKKVLLLHPLSPPFDRLLAVMGGIGDKKAAIIDIVHTKNKSVVQVRETKKSAKETE